MVEEGVGGFLDAADVEAFGSDEAFRVMDLDVGRVGVSGERDEVVGEECPPGLDGRIVSDLDVVDVEERGDVADGPVDHLR